MEPRSKSPEKARRAAADPQRPGQECKAAPGSFAPVVGQPVWFDWVRNNKPNASPQWTIPANLGQVDATADKASNYGMLLATPGAPNSLAPLAIPLSTDSCDTAADR